MRKLVICILIDNPVGAAIKQTTNTLHDVIFSNDPESADLIIMDDIRDGIELYARDKWFALFWDHRLQKEQKNNVREFDVLSMNKFWEFINEIKTKLPETWTIEPKMKVNYRIINNSLKILVVEDTLKHQKAAEILLSKYDLTIAKNYDEAMELISANNYDILLADLYMPTSKNVSQPILGELIPYGILLAMEASKHNIKHIGIVTDADHHTDPFSNAFDHFCQTYMLESSKTQFKHATICTLEGIGRVKNWQIALETLIKE